MVVIFSHIKGSLIVTHQPMVTNESSFHPEKKICEGYLKFVTQQMWSEHSDCSAVIICHVHVALCRGDI